MKYMKYVDVGQPTKWLEGGGIFVVVVVICDVNPVLILEDSPLCRSAIGWTDDSLSHMEKLLRVKWALLIIMLQKSTSTRTAPSKPGHLAAHTQEKAVSAFYNRNHQETQSLSPLPDSLDSFSGSLRHSSKKWGKNAVAIKEYH